MAREKDGIKVQVSHRLDDRITVTVKLIGWDAAMLSNLDLNDHLRDGIVRRIKTTIIESFKNL